MVTKELFNLLTSAPTYSMVIPANVAKVSPLLDQTSPKLADLPSPLISLRGWLQQSVGFCSSTELLPIAITCVIFPRKKKKSLYKPHSPPPASYHSISFLPFTIKQIFFVLDSSNFFFPFFGSIIDIY